jgi:hypothetical protein
MKYKKLLVLITCLLFITVAVFCFASAFKVKEIELNATTISGSSENIEERVGDYLKRYSNKNLLFIDEEEIKKGITSISGYIEIISVEKKIPNKIAVEINEKLEYFAFNCGSDYYALDSSLNVLAKKQDILNNVDKSSNILLTLSLADYNTNLEVSKQVGIYDSNTLNAILKSSSLLYENRDNLSEVVVTTKRDGFSYRTFTLKMKEGVEFIIYNVIDETLLKLEKTFEYYENLSNKGSGTYNVVLSDSGEILIS